MTSLTGNLMGKEVFKRFDKAPDVSRMGMLTNHLDDIGASMWVLQDVTSMVELLNGPHHYGAEVPSVHHQRVCQNCVKHYTERHQTALPA